MVGRLPEHGSCVSPVSSGELVLSLVSSIPACDISVIVRRSNYLVFAGFMLMT